MLFNCKISRFSCDLGSIHRQQSEIVEQKFKKQNMMLALAFFQFCSYLPSIFCSNVQTWEKDYHLTLIGAVLRGIHKDPYFEKAT